MKRRRRMGRTGRTAPRSQRLAVGLVFAPHLESLGPPQHRAIRLSRAGAVPRGPERVRAVIEVLSKDVAARVQRDRHRLVAPGPARTCSEIDEMRPPRRPDKHMTPVLSVQARSGNRARIIDVDDPGAAAAERAKVDNAHLATPVMPVVTDDLPRIVDGDGAVKAKPMNLSVRP